MSANYALPKNKKKKTGVYDINETVGSVYMQRKRFRWIYKLDEYMHTSTVPTAREM